MYFGVNSITKKLSISTLSIFINKTMTLDTCIRIMFTLITNHINMYIRWGHSTNGNVPQTIYQGHNWYFRSVSTCLWNFTRLFNSTTSKTLSWIKDLAIHSIFFLPVHPTTGIERSYLPHQKFILIIYLNMTFMKTTHNIKVSNWDQASAAISGKLQEC